MTLDFATLDIPRTNVRVKAAQSPAAWAGQSTLIAVLPRRTSIRISPDPAAGTIGNARKPGAITAAVSSAGVATRRVGGSIPRSRIQRRTWFALTYQKGV